MGYRDHTRAKNALQQPLMAPHRAEASWGSIRAGREHSGLWWRTEGILGVGELQRPHQGWGGPNKDAKQQYHHLKEEARLPGPEG